FGNGKAFAVYYHEVELNFGFGSRGTCDYGAAIGQFKHDNIALRQAGTWMGFAAGGVANGVIVDVGYLVDFDSCDFLWRMLSQAIHHCADFLHAGQAWSRQADLA